MTLTERLRILAIRFQAYAFDDEDMEDAEALRQAADLIERLPVTADGVPVVPGMEVWHRDFKGRISPETAQLESPFPHILICCYSTRAAAEAAKKGADDGTAV